MKQHSWWDRFVFGKSLDISLPEIKKEPLQILTAKELKAKFEHILKEKEEENFNKYYSLIAYKAQEGGSFVELTLFGFKGITKQTKFRLNKLGYTLVKVKEYQSSGPRPVAVVAKIIW